MCYSPALKREVATFVYAMTRSSSRGFLLSVYRIGHGCLGDGEVAGLLQDYTARADVRSTVDVTRRAGFVAAYTNPLMDTSHVRTRHPVRIGRKARGHSSLEMLQRMVQQQTRFAPVTLHRAV